jgi:hypothetical protein
MTVAVLVEPEGTQFAATLAGVPELRTVGSTRTKAIDALRAEIERRIAAGELVSLHLHPRDVSALAGVFRDDPTLRDICADAYRERDAELGE